MESAAALTDARLYLVSVVEFFDRARCWQLVLYAPPRDRAALIGLN